MRMGIVMKQISSLVYFFLNNNVIANTFTSTGICFFIILVTNYASYMQKKKCDGFFVQIEYLLHFDAAISLKL